MNKVQFTFGALTTLSVNAIAFLTVLGEEIVKHGFVIAIMIIFAFVSLTKVAIGNTTKDNEDTDWNSIISFVVGSLIATIVTLVLGLIAIG